MRVPRRAANPESVEGCKHSEPLVFPAPKPGAKKLRHSCTDSETASPCCTARPLLSYQQYKTSTNPPLVTQLMRRSSIVKTETTWRSGPNCIEIPQLDEGPLGQ